MKTAIVIGATGLVGSHLVELLLADERFELVKVFVRRHTGKLHNKLEEHIINFDTPIYWQHLVTGDVLFSALGTTLKKAGSKEAQYKIDYTYQYLFAKIAAQNNVPTYVLVSSAGASPNSKIFYSRMKGELEREVFKLNFKHIHIIQPGILMGQREETRIGEKIGIAVLSVLYHIPRLKGYRPIPAETVAKAMIRAAFDETKPLQTVTLGEVFELGNKVS